jgi:hypothetical protein
MNDQELTEAQAKTLGAIRWTGSNDIRIYADGSWIAPASAARLASDEEDGSIVARWTASGYVLQEGR